jgi:hypothetical protein
MCRVLIFVSLLGSVKTGTKRSQDCKTERAPTLKYPQLTQFSWRLLSLGRAALN